MNKSIKSILKKTGLYQGYYNFSVNRRHSRELRDWVREGRTAVPAPHLIKQQVLREYAEKYSLNSLVETGTLHGDMVEAMKGSFEMIYSIELSPKLYEEARDRFRKDSNVEIIQGDSGEELGKLVSRLKEPALFWLDGHYSGGDTARGAEDTPIYKELGHILSCGEMGHVIIIDDAHLFGADPSYPTMEELEGFVISKNKGVETYQRDNMIRVVPKG